FLRHLISTLFPYTTLFRSIQLLEQLFNAGVFDDFTFIDDRHVAAEVFGLFEIMRGQYYRGAGAVDFRQKFPHGSPQLDIHSGGGDRKSTRLNSSHVKISYA